VVVKLLLGLGRVAPEVAMARRHWTQMEPRGVLDVWKKSRLGLGEFARSRGIVLWRLNWSKKTLAR
jgi:hypothetical protein